MGTVFVGTSGAATGQEGQPSCTINDRDDDRTGISLFAQPRGTVDDGQAGSSDRSDSSGRIGGLNLGEVLSDILDNLFIGTSATSIGLDNRDACLNFDTGSSAAQRAAELTNQTTAASQLDDDDVSVQGDVGVEVLGTDDNNQLLGNNGLLGILGGNSDGTDDNNQLLGNNGLLGILGTR
ncbi:MAG: hypothetical protein ACT4PW_07090 [Acidimicrobiia bacterium]